MKKFVFLFLMNLIITAKEKPNSSSEAVVISEVTNIIVERESFEYWFSRTVLIKNKNGLNFCHVSLVENDFKEIEEIRAVIKDTSGNIVKELDSDDIEETSITPGYVFYSGNNNKSFALEYYVFPFVIEYSYKISSNSLFFWTDWHPQNTVKTLNSEYNLVINNEVNFSTKKIGKIPDPTIEKKEDYTNYFWKLSDIDAFNDEDYLPPENKTQMALLFSPTNFEIAGYEGSNLSWDKFAEWYRNMASDKYSLLPQFKNEIYEIISGLKDTTEIVNALYKHLQTSTRYVAVEPGINGWQPHPANEVAEHRYGDCKDLSTYMIAMLDVAGIKAYPALARTSSLGKHDSSFVNSVFNHCIAVVPLTKDTLWLECTSSYSDINSLPNGIEDISVLVVKENSGEFITTPQKNSKQNFMKTKVLGALSVSGDFRFISNIDAGGNQKEYVKTKLEINSKDENLRYIKSRFGQYSANLKVDEYTIKNKCDDYFSFTFKGYYKNFSKKSGKRVFINLNLFNREEKSDIPEEEVEEREYPVFYNYPYIDIDTVEMRLPKKYSLETKEGEVKYETPFAYYKSSLKTKDDFLIYVRELEIKRNRIERERYAEYRDFISNVAKADRKKIILKKN